MNTRTEFGLYLSLTTGFVAVFAVAGLLFGEYDWLIGVVVTALAIAVVLTGVQLVVTRGAWPPSLTATEIRRAAFLGAACGPAAVLAVLLFGSWPLAVVALPVPALLAVLTVALWRILPEPIRAFFRFFRHFS